ncbi:hypothetical protein BCAH1134_C0631 (plasmid) [Bacillus cereus AH1134]|nr:hypothetical protein BCAH1134_C0631 [Bacillus cereus AH1134]
MRSQLIFFVLGSYQFLKLMAMGVLSFIKVNLSLLEINSLN